MKAALNNSCVRKLSFIRPNFCRPGRLRDYAAEYKRSVADSEAFWDEIARELEWFAPWKKSLNGSIRRSSGSWRNMQHYLQRS